MACQSKGLRAPVLRLSKTLAMFRGYRSQVANVLANNPQLHVIQLVGPQYVQFNGRIPISLASGPVLLNKRPLFDPQPSMSTAEKESSFFSMWKPTTGAAPESCA